MRYSEIFNVSASELEEKGVFDADMNVDSHLHIDPSLFKNCNIQEFIGAYDEFSCYFSKIFTNYVPYARQHKRYYDGLIEHLIFKEVANTCLGYSEKGTKGKGIGKKLAQQIANSILDIYDLGITNPTVFEMLPFFEDGIGADRISDLTAKILIRRLIGYTQRVCEELNIPMKPSARLNGEIISLPTYNGQGVVFVPSSVLCDLPTTDSWYDIDSVCDYNKRFRRRICEIIGGKITDVMRYPKKEIKRILLDNPDLFISFIEDWQNTSHRPYNFQRDKKHVMRKYYTTEIRKTFDTEYLKVFLADTESIKAIQSLLNNCNSVKRINITTSGSVNHPDENLTIYPKPMFNIEEVEKEVISALESFFEHTIIIPDQIVTDAVFDDIRPSIINELNQALNTIYVCVAWFTDDELKDVLVKKLQTGVDVRVITFQDGVNKKHGVDFGNIPNKCIRAARHGIMHRKYCVIDNHVVISGSYNWTDNAAERNDENILIVKNWETANQHTREFLDEWRAH